MRNSECGIVQEVFRTPLGWVGVAATERGVCRVVLPRRTKREAIVETRNVECGMRSAGSAAAGQVLRKAVSLLWKHFSGRAVAFDLPLDVRYYTPFQQAVWMAAAGIPYGETRSYAWVARKAGRPLAARAVGQAMGANPVPVLIP